MDVIIRQSDLDSLSARVLAAVAEMYRLTAIQLWGDIREEAPVLHGRLAGSFELEQMGRLTWRIFTAVDYALAVLEGSDPHEIVPNKAKALAFEVNGQLIFARRVRHPGNEANPFIDRAIVRTEDRLDDLAAQALDAVGG